MSLCSQISDPLNQNQSHVSYTYVLNYRRGLVLFNVTTSCKRTPPPPTIKMSLDRRVLGFLSHKYASYLSNQTDTKLIAAVARLRLNSYNLGI